MYDPNTCKHRHTRKAGTVLQLGKKRQRLQCVDCGKLLTDGEIIEKPAPSIGKDKVAQVASNNPVKEGECNDK